MRKLFIIIAALCVYMAGFCIFGYCQDDNSVEQSESQMGQNLDSEISSDQSENSSEGSEANTQYDAGEPMSL